MAPLANSHYGWLYPIAPFLTGSPSYLELHHGTSVTTWTVCSLVPPKQADVHRTHVPRDSDMVCWNLAMTILLNKFFHWDLYAPFLFSGSFLFLPCCWQWLLHTRMFSFRKKPVEATSFPPSDADRISDYSCFPFTTLYCKPWLISFFKATASSCSWPTWRGIFENNNSPPEQVVSLPFFPSGAQRLQFFFKLHHPAFEHVLLL